MPAPLLAAWREGWKKGRRFLILYWPNIPDRAWGRQGMEMGNEWKK